MGRHDLAGVRDADVAQGGGGVAQGGPVRLTAHDDGDRYLRCHDVVRSSKARNTRKVESAATGILLRFAIANPSGKGLISWFLNLRTSLCSIDTAFARLCGAKVMKIDGSRAINRTSAVRSTKSVSRTGAASASTGAQPVVDVATVWNIPEAELTPKVRDALVSLVAEVDQLRRELGSAKSRLEELGELADQDPLVPVYNRRAFLRELTRIMSFAERYEVQAALIYIDLNDFKMINDEYGHAAGDGMLNHIATQLVKSVRASDIVGRLGGDEFGIILARANKDVAATKARSLMATLERRPFIWEGKQLKVSAAHGVYSFEHGQDPEEALAKADRAMYERKAKEKSDRAS